MIKIKDITIIAIFSTLLFLQEQLLTFIPNFQLTVFLLVIFSKSLGLVRTLLIVLIHTILDNIFMSSFSFLYFPFMLIGWSIIPIVLCTIFKKVEKPYQLAIIGAVCSFIYCWLFIIPQALLTDVDIIHYIVVDIPWEIILAISSFLSILWLYKPCSNFLIKLNH